MLYTEKTFNLIINMTEIAKETKEDDWIDDYNKHVEAKVEEVQKERIEMKRLDIKTL